MELNEIEELPKKLLREEAGRAFRLQASASMDMWLCVKLAINAAEKAKKAYEDDRAKVAEAGKAIQDHTNLEKDLQAAERQPWSRCGYRHERRRRPSRWLWRSRSGPRLRRSRLLSRRLSGSTATLLISPPCSTRRWARRWWI
ncbi:unnamed protein product [Prunus armeniaca]